MDKFLAESESFKVYSLSDNVYLKVKNSFKSLSTHEKKDIYLCHVYGEPEGALISPTEDYVVVVGHGLSIANMA
ncbi:hypothetical protein [Hahella ganghwensis]|uniref:hypothetical protein n=1 Tax=Hahella ganghwensis TaxID=286420 RepID=UPI000363CE14|nr:hypothetical protein [Hahella ganghwensis]